MKSIFINSHTDVVFRFMNGVRIMPYLAVVYNGNQLFFYQSWRAQRPRETNFWFAVGSRFRPRHYIYIYIFFILLRIQVFLVQFLVKFNLMLYI